MRVTVKYKNAAFSRTHMQRFFPLYEAKGAFEVKHKEAMRLTLTQWFILAK